MTQTITPHLLGNRNFRLFWVAQIISTLGGVLYDVGVIVTIFEQTGSALQTVGVTIAMTLPPFLLGPFAGALVDRYPRKRVMVVMELSRAGLVGSLLWLEIHQISPVMALVSKSIWTKYYAYDKLMFKKFNPSYLANLGLNTAT